MNLALFQWYLGWGLILIGFVSGASLGLGFAQSEFLGGYQSFRRRLWRLGHIACVMLGAGNIAVQQLLSSSASADPLIEVGRVAVMVGGVTMPVVCLLSGWRKPFRHLFFLPVVALIMAVVLLGWRVTP